MSSSSDAPARATSPAPESPRGDRPIRDYGYLASFEGPSGGHVLVIAGARDIGVMQTAEVASDRGLLADLRPAADGSLEALYEVDGVGRTNLRAIPVAPAR